MASERQNVVALAGFFVLLLVSIIVLSFWGLPDLRLPDHSLQAPPLLPVHQSMRSKCPVTRQACTIVIDGKPLLFRLRPDGLPALTPLNLEVQIDEQLASSSDWSAWFEGRSMDMGLHFLALDEGHSTENAGLVHLSGMIPLCTVDAHMLWMLNVQFVYQNKRYRVLFDAAMPE